jgi:hypothetical protein
VVANVYICCIARRIYLYIMTRVCNAIITAVGCADRV